MRNLHQRVRETKKFLSLSSSRLCLKGWGSSSLKILQVCSCADPGSSQLGTPVAKRCCRGILEVYRGTGVLPMKIKSKFLTILFLHSYSADLVPIQRGKLRTLSIIHLVKLLQPFSQQTRPKQVVSDCHSFITII